MRLTIIAIVFVSIIIVLMLLLVLQRLNKKKTIAKLLYKQRSEKMLMEIANLQTRIDQNNLQIQCLEKEQLDWDFKIEEKMREVQELAKQKNKLRNALFQQTSSYTKIQKLSKQDRSDNKSIKVLTQAEQIELRKTIFQIYEESVAELQEKFQKRKVFLKYDTVKYDAENNLLCYIYLDNKTFVNNHLVRTGYVDVDTSFDYICQKKFLDSLPI